MKIKVTTPKPQDYEEFTSAGLNAEMCLEDRVKLLCEDEAGHQAVSFMKREDFDRLGMEYLQSHGRLEYSRIGEQWYFKCSENDWYNDLTRNPEKVVPVKFVEIECGTGREVYRGVEDGRYYLRDVSNREPFAKWLVCGKRRVIDDGWRPRPNLVFQHGNQTEKVVYDDWDETAAYSEQFNKNFRDG